VKINQTDRKMKREKIITLTLLLIPTISLAEYQYITNLEDNIVFINGSSPTETWAKTTSLTTEWASNGLPFDCSNWLPDVSSILNNSTINQNTNNCKINESRSIQERELSNLGNVRNSGVPTIEHRTENNKQSSRTYTVSYTEWVQVGTITCTDWTPNPADYRVNVSFEQIGVNCISDFERIRSDSYKENNTTTVLPSETIVSNQPTTDERTTMGTKTYDDTPYALTDSNWINGVMRANSAAFFIENNEWNRSYYTVGDSIKFADGQVRQITSINLSTSYMNIFLNGAILNGQTVGYPNKITRL
jgi:hypothetical protein